MLNGLFDIIANLCGDLFIIIAIVLLIGGFFLLIKSADVFVDAASAIAKKLHIPSLIIGLTIVSIGTSLPEFAVSFSSALNGNADISVGNVIGSNIFNLLIVFGSSLIFAPTIFNKKLLRRDLPWMLFCGLMLVIFILFGENGTYGISRIEGIILLLFFIIYIAFMIFKELKDKKMQNAVLINKNESLNLVPLENLAINNTSTTLSNKQTSTSLIDETAYSSDSVPSNDNKISESDSKPLPKEKKTIINVLLILLGIAGIILGGESVTYGAKTIALKIGISDALVGLTIVSIGTSLPELITSIVAAKKKECDIAIGNIVGSNIFNIIFILGLTSIIIPINVKSDILIDAIVMTSLFTLFFIIAITRKKMTKGYGIGMVVIYLLYLAYLILRDFVFV